LAQRLVLHKGLIAKRGPPKPTPWNHLRFTRCRERLCVHDLLDGRVVSPVVCASGARLCW